MGGSQIYMGTVPNGAVILGGEVQWNALGANTAFLGVGDSDDCTRFMESTIMPMAQQVGLPPFQPELIEAEDAFTR
mgnify:CR=1 FL=1